MAHDTLKRFLDAQAADYPNALAEIRQGRKQSHWMWYMFPQLAGLGYSEMARFYAIRDLNEASAYLAHPILGARLIELSAALLDVKGKTAGQILGSPDDLKLRSSMTLFSRVTPTDPVFDAVLANYYQGVADSRTLGLLKEQFGPS